MQVLFKTNHKKEFNRAYSIGKKSFILFFLFFISHHFFAQHINRNDDQMINSLDGINTDPTSIHFKNSFDINNKGGHIQGIQFIEYDQTEYYVFTGSSDAYSYFSIVKTGQKNEVISVNKILDKPFKHAGGFQIHKKLMAIGVEDNSLKDKSKVIVYNLENPEQAKVKILTTIERSGMAERATAGCVAIHEMDNYILVIVGDWDTRHLDFYRIKKENLGKNEENFELTYSIDTEKMDRTAWVDPNWLSYQNINLIKDASGNLYLAGLTSNSNHNFLDLFKVYNESLQKFSLVKIHSKSLSLNENSNFIWGAGVRILENNELRIISSGSHIRNQSYLNIYKK